MVPLLSELLGLSGIDVESYQESEDGLILEVEAHRDTAICPRCGTLSHHLHQNHGYLVRDLPISHYRKTWLRVNRRQFKCSTCGKPFSEELEFVGARRVYTDRYAEVVVSEVIHSNTANVARQHGLSEDIVWSMVEYVSEKKSVLT
ncbi:transposase family protein [Halomicronema hongdechloris C2206]|uniref:Transposase family protein n=1 Tax=Halomicronema hongdechloris C2206 TaxID=1641165 RepID=A0A1Z3HPB7_9CYAN|nr:transposase family protein [Halomicronema hongdechloris]ASC70360.1 transposase family protein [Halomicronema hongdechloris C2206]ASC70624.1 transposase family protein [Halomicronema hongdechloris C2206]ASC70950.1 transposase family protein [Halomicronema hongdechloris C2206]ASC72141.1 transposase family protein [Halomicronema hongdechloris C2206]ASC73667.1 transposase family protein [Halomicronema hongdechloris C2206]